MPVDLFGQMAPIEAIAAAVPGLPIIEDAAQSIGARRMIDGEWRMAGEVATIGTFSFFPSKNLGGYGDGGMLVTQDDALAERLQAPARARRREAVLPRRGRLQQPPRRAAGGGALAPSCRISPGGARSAARTPRTTTRRSPTCADVRTPVVRPENESIFNQYTIRVPRRDALQAFLKERGIGTAIYYPLPLHLQPCFAYLGYREGQCPESERAAGEVLSLPIFPELSDAQLDEVVAGVRAFFGR